MTRSGFRSGLHVVAVLAILAPLVLPESTRAASSCQSLGERLFYDRRLSGSSVLSCASCHDPARAFTDGQQLSDAYPGSEGFRNTPSLYGVAGRNRWMWDGSVIGALEEAVLAMLDSPIVMNMDRRLMAVRLRQDAEYVAMFRASGHEQPTAEAVASCIAEYLEAATFTAMPGEAETPAVRRGRALFDGKARCRTCHSGEWLTDEKLHRTGVPKTAGTAANDARRRVALTVTARRRGWTDSEGPIHDLGAGFADAELTGSFLTPGLVHVVDTAPYMHNGSLKTLEDVVEHYDQGGGQGPGELEVLSLADPEKRDLVAYLKSLRAPRKGSLRTGAAKADRHPNKGMVELGRLLFFDKRLSGDVSRSCASCHDPKAGWSFAEDFSLGYPNTANWRNAPTVMNVAFLDRLFWDGRAGSLEMQAEAAMLSPIEGNGDRDVIESRLAQIPEYRRRFREVFGTSSPRIADVWTAIAEFERSLLHLDTPYDRYVRGDEQSLTEAQKRGLSLFTGKGNCVRCHSGPLLTDQAFHDTGVPPVEPSAFDELFHATFEFHTAALEGNFDDDPGRFLVSGASKDIGAFRTAPLRYIAHTAPYMHNGSLWTLSEVVEFYNRGGDGAASSLIEPLNLSSEEIGDLVSFLEALSGPALDMRVPELPAYGGGNTTEMP